jgi:hypothetical protein
VNFDEACDVGLGFGAVSFAVRDPHGVEQNLLVIGCDEKGGGGGDAGGIEVILVECSGNDLVGDVADGGGEGEVDGAQCCERALPPSVQVRSVMPCASATCGSARRSPRSRRHSVATSSDTSAASTPDPTAHRNRSTTSRSSPRGRPWLAPAE